MVVPLSTPDLFSHNMVLLQLIHNNAGFLPKFDLFKTFRSLNITTSEGGFAFPIKQL